MPQVTLGRTGITVNKNGFGALPIQRISKNEAVYLLKKAYDNGITFFDTARSYTDSEEKVGEAFSGIRNNVIIATKSPAANAEEFNKNLETSLKLLRTDYIDIIQFHNPSYCPKEGDETGLYEAAVKARKQGKVRFIGITNHRLYIAEEAAACGLYDTLQYPFSYLSIDREEKLTELCKHTDVGFIAMKALSGGLITDSAAAYAYLSQYDNVLPIWGIQKESELDEFLSYIKTPPVMNKNIEMKIEKDRSEICGDFCRGCAYCMPCPAKIEINTCARMSLLIRRSPSHLHLTEAAKAMMKKIEDCINCNQCMQKCPYSLNTPKLLKENYKDYKEILDGKSY